MRGILLCHANNNDAEVILTQTNMGRQRNKVERIDKSALAFKEPIAHCWQKPMKGSFLMKNMATNQKLILLMLITALLMCWAQGVSHGGGAGSAIGDAVGAVGGAVGTAIGAAGTAVGIGIGAAVSVLAGTVLIAAGVLDLSVRLVATVVWHTDSLSNMTLFPNGGIIGVVVSNLIHLGDSYTVAPHTTLTYHSPINSIAFSPINPLLASASGDGTIQLWDLNTNTLHATLRGHTSDVLNVAFSRDGLLLASGSADGTVRLWNPNTETLEATLQGHTASVLSVAFSSDGSLLASGSADGTVRLWNPVTETLQATLKAHMDSVLNVAFSPDGLLLASASEDGLVGLWDPHTETLQATLGHESPVLSVAFSPDSDLLATGSTDGVARLWDPHTPEHKATLGHESPVESVAFDGNTLVTGSQDGRVRQWEITSETAPTFATQRSESACQVGDIFAPGESCTYPNTDATFSVLDNGNAQLDIPELPPWINNVSIGGSLSITATINDEDYHFVATELSSGSWEIDELGDSSGSGSGETHGGSESQPDGITASTTAPLTETTLDASIVTLTLSGGTYESSSSRIRNAVTVSTSISGVTVRTFDIDRFSDTQITVELTFDGTDFDTNSTITFTVAEGAIANYSGAAFTAQIPVTSGSESLVASTDAPLTETTLDESVVTLTLSGRTYERSSFRIRNAVTVSGISGVTVGTFDIDRVSDTVVTVELTFGGNIDTNSTLTITVAEGAIANYSGAAFTAQIPVTSGSESLVASTDAPLTETTLDESVVTLTLSGRIYEDSSFSVRRAVTVSGIMGVTVGTFDVDRVSDTEVTVELQFDGTDFDTDATLTFTVEAGAIAGYDGPAFIDQIPVSASTESVLASTASPLTESTLDESVVTLTLNGRTYERSSFRIRDAITISGIDGVTVGTFGVRRVNDTTVTIELEFSGNFQTDSRLIFTVGAGAITNYSGSALTAEIPVTAGLEADANNDGVVDIQDLVLVASNYGQTGTNAADVNGDGVVNVDDVLVVTGALDNAGAAPSVYPQMLELFTAADVKLWLSHARQLDLTDPTSLKGVLFLEQLLAVLLPTETVLLPNYPNPFNPETWIPYHLAKDADVTLTIYDTSGQAVRRFALGHQAAGMYQTRSLAVHWDGRNEFGEQVASSVYFYHLSAGDYAATRKMLILK